MVSICVNKVDGMLRNHKKVEHQRLYPPKKIADRSTDLAQYSSTTPSNRKPSPDEEQISTVYGKLEFRKFFKVLRFMVTQDSQKLL